MLNRKIGRRGFLRESAVGAVGGAAIAAVDKAMAVLFTAVVGAGFAFLAALGTVNLVESLFFSPDSAMPARFQEMLGMFAWLFWLVAMISVGLKRSRQRDRDEAKKR